MRHRDAAADHDETSHLEDPQTDRRRPPRLAIFLHWQNNHGLPACDPPDAEFEPVTADLGLVDCPDCVLWLERVVRKMLGRKKT